MVSMLEPLYERSRYTVWLDFLDDDLDDDVECVKRIYREHEGLSGNGFNAW